MVNNVLVHHFSICYINGWFGNYSNCLYLLKICSFRILLMFINEVHQKYSFFYRVYSFNDDCTPWFQYSCVYKLLLKVWTWSCTTIHVCFQVWVGLNASYSFHVLLVQSSPIYLISYSIVTFLSTTMGWHIPALFMY